MKILHFLIIILLFKASYAWELQFGSDTLYDEGRASCKTSDNGYIITGSSGNFLNAELDLYMLKLNGNGELQWEKRIGGELEERGWTITATTDGNFIISGLTKSKGHGSSDFYTIMMDLRGNIIFEKTYGSEEYERCYSITNVSDDGFIMNGVKGTGYVYVVRIDKEGSVLWEKTYGPQDEFNYGRFTIETSDGGFINCGAANHYSSSHGDAYIFKTDRNGNLLWEKFLGGDQWDNALCVRQTRDNCYIAGGYTFSFGSGNGDFYVIKMDSSGNAIWEKTYGGEKGEISNSLVLTEDGGFIMCGYTESYGKGGEDAFVVKADSSGNLVWQKTFGDTLDDWFHNVFKESDNVYTLTGITNYVKNSDATGDVFFVKIDGNGSMINERRIITRRKIHPCSFPNPFTDKTYIRFHLLSYGKVTVTIYDITGKFVAKLCDKYMDKGSHDIIWNGKDFRKNEAGNGIYFYEIITNLKHESGKILHFK
ncbi:MAG: T9SS type A sorting domain-containing protein [Candidatus Coatesbacteria bacterium]|nr:T9SS type A sorting domain-containing protein [Candidatus Coatesbacteria bacterium]